MSDIIHPSSVDDRGVGVPKPPTYAVASNPLIIFFQKVYKFTGK